MVLIGVCPSCRKHHETHCLGILEQPPKGVEKIVFLHQTQVANPMCYQKYKLPASLYQSSAANIHHTSHLAAHLHTFQLLGCITTDWITSILQCLEAIGAAIRRNCRFKRVSLHQKAWILHGSKDCYLFGGHGQKKYVYTEHMYLYTLLYKWAVHPHIQVQIL